MQLPLKLNSTTFNDVQQLKTRAKDRDVQLKSQGRFGSIKTFVTYTEIIFKIYFATTSNSEKNFDMAPIYQKFQVKFIREMENRNRTCSNLG